MRIIAGKLKGRRLYTPRDRQIRPTADKVKEALFSMLSTYLGEGCVVADLFCGTGNLGLEAISRGAGHVYFGDRSKDSIRLVKQNIDYCKVTDQVSVLQGDYSQIIPRIKEKVDVFFLDPPYHEDLLSDCIKKIADFELLATEGIIVAEHDAKERMPAILWDYTLIKEKRYGNIGISIYTKVTEEEQ